MLSVACSSAPESVGTAGSSAVASTASIAPMTSSTTTTVVSTTTVLTTTTSLPSIEECLDVIPLEVKVGQLLFPVIAQSELVAAATLASTGKIAGVVLVGNVSAGVDAQIAEFQASSLVGPSLMAVDEEGGRVQRLTDLVGAFPSARALAAANSPEEAGRLSQAHAEKLAQLGFTMNLAPVLDLDNGSYIRDRSFGAEPGLVTE